MSKTEEPRSHIAYILRVEIGKKTKQNCKHEINYMLCLEVICYGKKQ